MNQKSNFETHSESGLQWLRVDGMSCEHCRQAVERAALTVAGVTGATVDLAAGVLSFRGGDAESVSLAVGAAGYAVASLKDAPRDDPGPIVLPSASAPPKQPYMLRIGDMHCASCVHRVEQAIAAVAGVESVTVNLVEQQAAVAGGDPAQVVAAVTAAGYEAALVEASRPGDAACFEVDVLGMHCASCVHRVEQAILAVPGVIRAAVNLVDKKALVEGGSPAAVVQAILDQGYGASLRQRASGEVFFFRLQPHPNEEEVRQLREIVQVQDPAAEVVDLDGRLRLTTHEHPADALLRLADMGYTIRLEEAYIDPSIEQAVETRREIRRSWQRAALAGAVGFGLMAGEMSGLFPPLAANRLFWAGAALLCLITMYFCGRGYFIGAWKQARHGSANMDTLVALGTGAAWVSSILVIADPQFIPGGGNHLYLDASVMILAFLQLGHALETRAKRTTSEAISALLGLRARTASVARTAGEVDVPVSLLRVGDLVRVRPGEKVPIDGLIVQGSSTIDESMLTGEPMAVARQVGDEITGGTMNRSGSFLLKVTRLGEDTTLARIIRLVKAAQMSKPPIGRLVDRIASVFVPAVIALALATFAAWMFLGPEPRLAFALTTAIAVLVIACPCALGLATPIAIMVGTSRAAQANVLIRNSDGLQTASSLTHVVVDKTGTLTQGRPAVTMIVPVIGVGEDEVLQWAASLESGSEHPLAEAVLEAQRRLDLPLLPMDHFSAGPGRGVEAQWQGASYLLGNDHFLEERGVALPSALVREAKSQAGGGGTPVWLAGKGEVLGLLVLKDPVRSDSATAVQELRRRGIRVVMCTGDNRATAEAVAREVGITEVHSEILPEAKLEVIRSLQAQGGKVGMVGDGVNDSPALAQADTGFALGGGTDVAIENADITLVGDSLGLVATAIAISTATLRNIKQNLFGAFIYNLVGIPLAAGLLYPVTGWLLDPMFASAAMALSSVTVVTNANRLRFFRLR